MTITDLRTTQSRSGFRHVYFEGNGTTPIERMSAPWMARVGSGSTGFYIGRFATAETAAQAVCDYLNGQQRTFSPPADPSAPVAPKTTRRRRSRSHGNRKTPFPKAHVRFIKRRDSGCKGAGRYFPGCDGTFPLSICQVDHIDPDGEHDVDNGQVLCQNCHGWKCAIERGRTHEELLAEWEAMIPLG